METQILDLERPRPLTREELRIRETRRAAAIVGVISGFTLGVALVMSVCGFEAVQATDPIRQQVASKLEIPSAAVLSLPEMVEIAQPEKETHAWDVPLTGEELSALLEVCEAGHISPAIGLGLIQVESSFRADALNERSGCYGYCQLNPQYFSTGLSPADNIRTGIEYLAYQLERYDGDLGAALTAYNAGRDTGDRTYAEQVIAASAAFGG